MSVHCTACGNDVNPVVDMNDRGQMVQICSTPDCRAGLGPALVGGNAGVSTAPPNPYKGPDVTITTPQQPDRPSPAPLATAKAADPIELARDELFDIDAELTRLGALQTRRRRLAAMVAAADAFDAEPETKERPALVDYSKLTCMVCGKDAPAGTSLASPCPNCNPRRASPLLRKADTTIPAGTPMCNATTDRVAVKVDAETQPTRYVAPFTADEAPPTTSE